MPISTSSTEVGNAVVQLYNQVRDSISQSEYTTAKVSNMKWAGIQTQLSDPVKVYNTLLKTRYILENNLF